MLRIGISSCFFHPDPLRPVFKGKRLLYLVEDVAHWVMQKDVLAYLIPSQSDDSAAINQVVDDLDGLILQGGSDVSPTTYGETPLKPEWSGDVIRDQYEAALVKEFMLQNKPILGICRGLQLLNATFGGTLFQDITTQVKGALTHRNWDIYDQNLHEIEIVAGSSLSKLFPGATSVKVNSVHHQAIKGLAPGFQIEATSKADGIIEAIRWNGPEYICAIQWHPEFQKKEDQHLLDPTPLMNEFLNRAKKRKANA